MSTFRLALHAVSGKTMVEVWEGREFIAAIYPSDVNNFKIVSKFPIVCNADGYENPYATMVTIGSTPP